jgi:hypothetical protein
MSRFARAGVILFCLTGLVTNAVILKPAYEFIELGQTDFMDLYAGGKLAGTGDLYIPARVLETELRTEGRSSVTRLFMRLPCFAFFYWPLAQIPYRVASVLWETLCALAMAALWMLWPRNKRWHVAAACCWSLPLMMSLAEGQDLGFILLAMAIAATRIRRKRPAAGAFIASLCLAKFHLFLLIPVWICAARQWRYARGLIAGCSLLAVLSFIAGGWRWPVQYLALVMEPANNPYREVMPNLHSLLAGFPYAGVLEIAAEALLAAAVWIASRKRSEWGLAAALAGGILVAPDAYMADGALMIPVLLLLMKTAKEAWARVICFYLPWVLLMTRLAMPVRVGLGALVLGLAYSARTSAAGISIPFARRIPSTASSSLPGVATQP